MATAGEDRLSFRRNQHTSFAAASDCRAMLFMSTRPKAGDDASGASSLLDFGSLRSMIVSPQGQVGIGKFCEGGTLPTARALQHYLGHKNIQHTVRYTEMAPDRFKDFWRD